MWVKYNEIKHMVRVPPMCFGETLNKAVVDELNRKLANKVLLDVGLCISLFDVISLEDSYIFPGDGASHTRVTFRFVVFRPFLEEVIEGTIKGSNSEGLQVTLGFFEDVYIQKDSMMVNSRFDETENTWIWDYQTEDAIHPMYMDVGEKIRFKVNKEQFTDTTPANPNPTSDPKPSVNACEKKKDTAPYIIYGSIKDQGLGLVSWWNQTEACEDDGEEQEMDDGLTEQDNAE